MGKFKPGDIISAGQLIILFKGFEGDTTFNFVFAYAGIDISGKLQITDGHWLISNEATLATEEQRYKLLNALGEAGYEWDPVRLELKHKPDIQAKEMVEHPSHYKKEGRKECIEEMVEKFGESAVYVWCALNHYKYNYRKSSKEGNSELQDIQKGVWYLNYANKLDKEFVPDNIVDYIKRQQVV